VLSGTRRSEWKFEPTILDGQAVEVESELKIGFTLDP
jgi:hypothetical protein